MTTKMLRKILTVALLALLSVAQAGAVEYRNQYKVQSIRYNVQGKISNQPSVISIQTTAPVMGFQSTSAMPVSVGVGTSTLNEDGTVNADAYGVGRQHVGQRRGGNPGTPDDETEEEGEQQPLSDALLPLALMAIAYSLVTRVRRKRI